MKNYFVKHQFGFTSIEFLVVLAILILALAGGVVVWEKKVKPPSAPTQTPTISVPASTSQVGKPNEVSKEESYGGVPNPASIYCIGLGYKDEIRTDDKGGQYGVCIFPGGIECPDWDFYRGMCGQKFSYCEKQGFKIKNRIDDMGTWTSSYAVCVFNDGSECGEQDYAKSKCQPSECKEWVMSKGGCLN